jgi:uncharacterized protein YlzI (FlbEa/FlbD family)
MWIDLTDHDSGSQLRVNLDNVTYIEARTIEGRGYALLNLTSGQTLGVREDISEVARKMMDPLYE